MRVDKIQHVLRGRGMTPCFGSLVSQSRDMVEIALGDRGRRQIKKRELSLYIYIIVAVLDGGYRSGSRALR